MLQPGSPFPPSIPGVSEGIPTPDPMQMIAAMFAPQRQMTGMQAMMEAIAALKRAGSADPRLEDSVQAALAILTTGPQTPQPTGRGGQPDTGPTPGGIWPVRGPR